MTDGRPPGAWPAAPAAWALAIAVAWAAPGRAEGILSVCLDKAASASPSRGDTALPSRGDAGAQGFDLAVARALAPRIGRTLAVQWYESEADNDANPDRQMNALLSDGRCQLVLGYPLLADALGRPRAERSRLPGYDGAKPEDRRRWVRLNELAASRGYRFDPLAVVLGPGAAGREVHSLADLKPLRLVAEERTLGDAVLMSYGGGMLIGRITHVVPGRDLFESMERGDGDATLVELHRFDAYRAQRPDTRLSSSGHYHSIGFNIGAVGLASDGPLMAEVDAAIGDMLARDELPALARAVGLTFLPPREPNISATITRARLNGD